MSPNRSTNSGLEQSRQFDLWPIPQPPASYSPRRLAGITPESTSILRELLNKNHEAHHIFYDGDGRHNHISHHMLALWSLGADKDILEAGYKLHSTLQQPLKGSGGGLNGSGGNTGDAEVKREITKENFHDRLGDWPSYAPYLAFFTSEVSKKGGFACLEEYILSHDQNRSTTDGGKNPEMLGRFMGGLFHPIIHIGYGAEFGLPGMFVEGLAQIAITSPPKSLIIPDTLFTASNEPSPNGDVHALTILARVLKDSRFNVPFNSFATLQADVKASVGTAPVEYAFQWLPDSEPDDEAVKKKIEEVVWALVVICTVSGFKKGVEYNADFVGMHLVTSSLFVQSIVPQLRPKSRGLFLRSYFAACLVMWARLGTKQLDIKGYFAEAIPSIRRTNEPNESGAKPSTGIPAPAPSKFLLSSSNLELTKNPNPWLEILHHSLVHPDDHVPKFQRALYEYASKYGVIPKGYFAHTELAGAEELDGTLFLRAAGLTIRKLGREVEELPKNYTFWDRGGFREESGKGSTY